MSHCVLTFSLCRASSWSGPYFFVTVLTVSSNYDTYTTSDHLPKYLLSKKGASYDVTETAFQNAIGTTKTRWDWLAERVSPDQVSPKDSVGYPGIPSAANADLKPDKDGLVTRPELDNFGLAMIGGGQITGAAHPFGQWSNATLTAS